MSPPPIITFSPGEFAPDETEHRKSGECLTQIVHRDAYQRRFLLMEQAFESRPEIGIEGIQFGFFSSGQKVFALNGGQPFMFIIYQSHRNAGWGNFAEDPAYISDCPFIAVEVTVKDGISSGKQCCAHDCEKPFVSMWSHLSVVEKESGGDEGFPRYSHRGGDVQLHTRRACPIVSRYRQAVRTVLQQGGK